MTPTTLCFEGYLLWFFYILTFVMMYIFYVFAAC